MKVTIPVLRKRYPVLKEKMNAEAKEYNPDFGKDFDDYYQVTIEVNDDFDVMKLIHAGIQIGQLEKV